MDDRETTQNAPVMDGANDAAHEDKKSGVQTQQAADAAIDADGTDAATDDLEDDLRSIRAYGEDR